MPRGDKDLASAVQQALETTDIKFAVIAKTLGVDRSTVSRWAAGAIPAPGRLDGLAQLLGIDLAQKHARAPRPFVASPVSGLDEERRPEALARTRRVVEAIRTVVADVDWPGELASTKHPAAAGIATEPTLRQLDEADGCVYIQLENSARASGALVEAGIALGRGKPTTLILGSEVARPFMFEQGFELVAHRLPFLPSVRILSVTDVADAVELIAAQGARLFQLDQRLSGVVTSGEP